MERERALSLIRSYTTATPEIAERAADLIVSRDLCVWHACAVAAGAATCPCHDCEADAREFSEAAGRVVGPALREVARRRSEFRTEEDFSLAFRQAGDLARGAFAEAWRGQGRGPR